MLRGLLRSVLDRTVKSKAVFRGRCLTGAGKANCQDAFFIKGQAFGVADGVGGWLEQGIDSGIYSRALCEQLSTRLGAAPAPATALDLRKHLTESNDFVRQQQILGSTTACVASLQDNILRVFNVGDSGILVLSISLLLFSFPPSPPFAPWALGAGDPSSLTRWHPNHDKFQIQSKTEIQTHFFNCPYQLGDDDPSMGDPYEIPLRPNSVIIAATDGLFDNLFDEMLLAHVKNNVSPIKPYREADAALIVERLLDNIIDDCWEKSQRTNYFSPFASECRKNGYEWNGGKSDDITVLTGMLFREP